MARPQPGGPVYGPVDPRVGRAPAEDGGRFRLRDLRAQRLEQMRQRRLERAGDPVATRPRADGRKARARAPGAAAAANPPTRSQPDDALAQPRCCRKKARVRAQAASAASRL